MILYTLVIINALNGVLIYEEPRTLHFAECRSQRDYEIERYRNFRKQKVNALCIPTKTLNGLMKSTPSSTKDAGSPKLPGKKQIGSLKATGEIVYAL